MRPPRTTVTAPQVRPLTDADDAASLALGAEAFGPPPAGHTPTSTQTPGRHSWGVFVDDRLVAKAATRSYATWWAGHEVPTSGVASVAVSPEHRGTGALSRLLPAVLDEARGRGEVLSTLYPTAPGIYRRFGYEVVTALDIVEVPVHTLTRVQSHPDVTLRRATLADVPAVRAVYDRWAAAQRGPLTRRGVSFPATDDDLLSAFTGITLAVDGDDTVLGYASWERGPGYDSTAWVRVADLLAVDPRAFPALWQLLGSFSTVTGTVRLRTSGLDAARLHLPVDLGRVVETHPYMLRVDDVAAAVTAVAPAPAGAFAVTGDLLGVQDGSYAVEDGTCRRTATTPGTGLPTLTSRGLALAYAGVQSAANLRLLGLLTGPSDHDAVLDAWFAGPPVHVRDYF